MPFLDHIIRPQLREQVDEIKRDRSMEALRERVAERDPAKAASYLQTQQQNAAAHAGATQGLEGMLMSSQHVRPAASTLGAKGGGQTPVQSDQLGTLRGRGSATRNGAPSGGVIPEAAPEIVAARGVVSAANPSQIADKVVPAAKRTPGYLGLEPEEKYDPENMSPEGHYAIGVGSLPKGPGWDQFKLGASGLYPTPTVGYMQGLEQPELARAVAPATYKKGTALPAFEPGTVTNEAGYAVDKKGKRLGYLDQEAANPNIRYLDRRITDVGLEGSKTKGAVRPSYAQDIDAQDMIKGTYDAYLKEYRDNGGKFFPEMFNKPQTAAEIKKGVKPQRLTPEEIKNVKAGVRYLLEEERGTKA